MGFLAAPGPATGLLSLLAMSIASAGELIERSLFFRAVSPARMPGGVIA
jgi:hypothetical protein